MKKSKAIITLVVTLLVTAALGYVAICGIGSEKAGAASQIKQGLDLAGGVSITYQVVGDEDPSDEDMSDTVYKLQKRVETYSTEALVYREGSDRINIEIPGVSDADAILEDLGRPGALYFIAQTDSEGNANYTYTGNGATGYALNKTIAELQEDGSIVLSGTDVSSAQGGSAQDKLGNSQFVVSLTFTDAGTKAFADATTKAYASGESIGIYYDQDFISVPRVQAAITDGQAQITGMESFEEADKLASQIRIGGLKLELEELRSNVVGAQLGSEAVKTSLEAGAIGLALVVIFMIAVYLIPGLASSIALIIYTILVVLCLNMFEITLTLPGIAGIILSVGMGVDGNVLSAERIREELKAGRTIDGAIKNGFQRGFTAILDSNLTVIIVAVILMLVFGTAFGASTDGTIFSFGFTLLVGVIMNFIMACWATRMMTTSLSRFKCFKKPWLYGGEKKAIIPTAAETAAAPAPAVPTNVGKDFVSKRKIFVIISSSIIVLTIIFTFVLGVKVDIRFKGGSMLTYSYSGEIGDAEMSTVKSAIAEIGNVPEVNVTTGTSFTGGLNTMVVSFAADEKMDDEMLNSINAAVEGALPDNAVENIDTTNVSASSGSSFFVSCLVAVVAAFILLAVYIAFRFQKIGGLSAGIIAIICLLHDVAITYAVYVFGGMTLDSNFMAVILTLLGYSINNTIIIYDRLRENRAKYGTKLTDTQLVNLSINQTMPRSIITTATTVCAMVSVSIVCALMGTTSILTFSIPLAIGMLVGFYSSVCLAGPIWIWVQEKRSKKTA